jgi:hypothetical protein
VCFFRRIALVQAPVGCEELKSCIPANDIWHDLHISSAMTTLNQLQRKMLPLLSLPLASVCHRQSVPPTI